MCLQSFGFCRDVLSRVFLSAVKYQPNDWPCRQWRQRLGNFGDGLTQKGSYPGGRKSPSGVQGRRPNKGSRVRTPKLILILEIDVKLELVLSTVTNPMGSR